MLGGGYAAPIPQPTLTQDGEPKMAKTSHPDLRLTPANLRVAGSLAARVACLLRMMGTAATPLHMHCVGCPCDLLLITQAAAAPVLVPLAYQRTMAQVLGACRNREPSPGGNSHHPKAGPLRQHTAAGPQRESACPEETFSGHSTVHRGRQRRDDACGPHALAWIMQGPLPIWDGVQPDSCCGA